MEYEIKLGKPVVYCVFRQKDESLYSEQDELLGIYSTLDKAQAKITSARNSGDLVRISTRIVDYFPY